MEINSDFRDLLRTFVDGGVRFLIVGAYAVMHHTVPRYTKDLDLWVEPTGRMPPACCERGRRSARR
jgi:hypothetical protein